MAFPAYHIVLLCSTTIRHTALLKRRACADKQMADNALNAAKEVSHKLMGGTVEVKHALSSVASSVTSWWSNLDPVKDAGGSAGKGKLNADGKTEVRAV